MVEEIQEKRAARAERTNRVLARFIDILIAAAIWKIIPVPIGFLAATTYLLIADGIPPGQSFGKRFIGLKVVVNPAGAHPQPCQWKQSMIRNLPFVFIFFIHIFSYLGMLIFIVGVILLAFETYFVFTDRQGIRLGDIFANTKVFNV